MTCCKWLWTRFGFVDHLALTVCFISYEKWMQRALYGAPTIKPLARDIRNIEDRDPPSTYVQCATILDPVHL